MELMTTQVRPGNWVRVEANIPPEDVTRHRMIIDGVEVPTGVDGGDVVARCPADVSGPVRVEVDGQLLRQLLHVL